ncbi:hypothetical protein ACIBSW_08520 [Actinoplanes sp. NPDC049668]|uniref:hypothetical protein n=1 Tax=unclassified Actinoplanes TaxID=2626549 RepID=UPI0033BAE84F
MDAETAVRNIRMRLIDQLVGYEVGSDQLIRVGLDALMAGVDSPSLSLLAGLSRREEPEARGLFGRVVEELGLGPPDLPEEPAARQWTLVRWFAELIADGELNPAVGGQLIWWHCERVREDQVQTLRPLLATIALHDDDISSWAIWDTDYMARNRKSGAAVVQRARDFLAQAGPT